MNLLKLLLFLTFLLSTVNSLKFNKDLNLNLGKNRPKYTVFNSGNNGNYATINLDTLETTTLATIKNLPIQYATYNKNLSKIVTISQQPNSNKCELYSFDTTTNQATSIGSWGIDTYNFSSIESDQSEDEYNLFATLIISSKNQPGTFTVAKLSSKQVTVQIIDILEGQFDTSTYHFTQENFLVHHSNSSGWFLNHYNRKGERVYSSRFNLLNINTNTWDIVGTPYALSYSPSNDVAYGASNLANSEVPSWASIFYMFFTWDVFASYPEMDYQDQYNVISVNSIGMYELDENVMFVCYNTRDTKNYPSGVAVYTIDTLGNDYNINGVDYPLIKLWSDY